VADVDQLRIDRLHSAGVRVLEQVGDVAAAKRAVEPAGVVLERITRQAAGWPESI
jgi:hypothetical protein